MASAPFFFRFNFEQARRQAKDLHHGLLANDADAVRRLEVHHPEKPTASAAQLADAQLVVAREHGFESWSRLKHYAEPQSLHQSEELADGQNSYVNGRPWEEQEARLCRLADEALSRCHLQAKQMSRAGHMGNFGYSDFALRVVTEDQEPSHLVTVRYPYDGFPLVEVHRQVTSLCAWLVAMDRQTELELQVPVADETGEFCQLLDHRPDGPAAACTVQRWVKGIDLVTEDEPVDLPEEALHELGGLLGGIHDHGRTWSWSDWRFSQVGHAPVHDFRRDGSPVECSIDARSRRRSNHQE